MERDYLFREAEFSAVLDAQHAKLRDKINGFRTEYLLGVDEVELAQALADEFNIQVPVLDVPNRTVDHHEENRRIRGDFDFINVTTNVYTVLTPFSGEAAVFRFSPNRTDFNPPVAAIIGEDVRIIVEQRIPEAMSLRTEIDRTTSQIEKYLGWLREMAAPFNAQLPAFATECVQYRKKKLGENIGVLTELGIPVRKRDSIPVSMTVPIRRKPLPLPKPKPAPNPKNPDPTLSEAVYHQIIKTMADMALTIERNPTAFENQNEEQIRFHFLVPLNSIFEGDATAETFSYKGKTDIQIRQQGRPIFTAECKFWTGSKGLLATIDQLLSYVTWRDTKTAILLFNRQREFGKVLAQIEPTLQTHTNFMRFEGVTNETQFRFILSHPNDKSRQIIVTVLAFDIP